MTELHLVVQLDDDYVDRFVSAFDSFTDPWTGIVEGWGYHAHAPVAPPSGEIVGWRVVLAPVEREFADHKTASWHAARTGGDLYPVFAEEHDHAPA